MKRFDIAIFLLALVVTGAMWAQPFDELKLRGTTVTYWYQHNKDREVALKRMIDRFNSTNTWGITVKGEYAGGYNDIYNKMTAAIAGGVTPDLVVAYQNQAAGYMLSDAIVDLNPYVNDPTFGIPKAERADYFPGFVAQDISSQFGGKRLGWPPNRSIEVLYYNADWLKSLGFKAPPSTWEEFAAMCKKATDATKGTTGCDLSNDASNVFAQVISRGGGFASPDGKSYRFSNPEMKAAMAFMRQLYAAGYAKKVGEQYGDQADFGNRKVLFTMGSTSGLPFYASAVNGSSRGPFSWSVTAIPHSTPKPAFDIYGASISIVKTTPTRQLAAWLFLKWMSEPRQQAEWVRASNYFPVRLSTAENLGDYLAKNRQFADAFNLLKAGIQRSEPLFAGYDSVRDAVSAAYTVILDGADIDATLVRLDEKANRILKETAP